MRSRFGRLAFLRWACLACLVSTTSLLAQDRAAQERAVDIDDAVMARLRKRLQEDGIDNVTIVKGATDDPSCHEVGTGGAQSGRTAAASTREAHRYVLQLKGRGDEGPCGAHAANTRHQRRQGTP
jgi:hypothetical protein